MKINVRVINVTNSLIPLTVLKISVANITGEAVRNKRTPRKRIILEKSYFSELYKLNVIR